MRLDRLITLGVVSPAREILQRRRKRDANPNPSGPALPILMYHSISDDPEPGVSPYYKVCTSPQRFAEQMQWLASAGWQGVTLSAGLDFLAGGTQPTSGRPVAITFDDGFRDFHTAAYPVLRQHGFSATMYLPTAFIGDERKTFKARECLTWSEVSELHQAGIEFGSHTVSHPKLVDLAWPDISTELRGSRTAIEERLGLPVRSFAYPYAFPQADKAFTRRFGEILTNSGYENCVTTIVGRASPRDNSLQLRRLPANGADDRSLFEAKLRGAYDWLALPQALLKKATHKARS